MKPRKPKDSEPSARDKLSASFMKAFESDFDVHGIDVIEKLRQESPAKYAEIAAKLIAAAEPKPDGFESCQSNREIAIKLLKSVGADEFELSEEAITEAMEANDRFVAALRAIRDAAEPMQ